MGEVWYLCRMSKDLKTERFLSMDIDPKLLDQVEDYRFAGKFPSRRAAVECLLRVGLKGEAAAPHFSRRLGARLKGSTASWRSK